VAHRDRFGRHVVSPPLLNRPRQQRDNSQRSPKLPNSNAVNSSADAAVQRHGRRHEQVALSQMPYGRSSGTLSLQVGANGFIGVGTGIRIRVGFGGADNGLVACGGATRSVIAV
jgi:hypothetical protein